LTGVWPSPGPSVTAKLLGRAGLLPFVTGAVLCWWGPPAWHAQAGLALAAYAAVIVSFLGGIHWGLAMRQTPAPSPVLLGCGVLPSLLAWPALMMPVATGLTVLGCSLWLCWAMDRRLYAAQQAQAWLELRLQLTAVASLSCWAAAAAAQGR
jgi:hypothetical protein